VASVSCQALLPGSATATRAAALACAPLRSRAGGLEAWDRWKRTAAAWYGGAD